MQKNLKIILISLWVIVGLAVGGVTAGVLWYRQHQAGPVINIARVAPDTDSIQTLPPMFDAPAFTLTDQDGKPFDSRNLRGKVWVADFVFTTCTGLCPMMTQQMSEFQKQTLGSDIQMVSFSVDPEHDTPAVLKTYATDAKADLNRWHFLTGSREMLWQISNSMKLAVGNGDNHQVMHSSHFLLVDTGGHVRGVYDYKDSGYLARLVKDARSLQNHN
jgi:protein SCO1/2